MVKSLVGVAQPGAWHASTAGIQTAYSVLAQPPRLSMARIHCPTIPRSLRAIKLQSLPSQSPSAVSDATHTDAETQLNPSTSIPLTKYRPLYGRNEESYIDDAGWIYTFGAPALTSSNGHLAFRLRLPSSLARDVPSGAVTEGGDAS